ncbi:C-factor-like [Mauremys mutica]|uniref:C-factor-like n=1 Tax=Mauremys mutica TaxID=74926 RepID=UPI001D16A3A6|nr:C-factor-like [Mauremys mutica]
MGQILRSYRSREHPGTAKKAEAHLGGSGLNLLINNARVMPESTLESATAADMLAMYKINVVGPMFTGQAFLPLLKKAEQKSTQTGLSCSKAAIINVSTIGGSIGNTPRLATFPVISYRCTKAALNMLTRCQSVTHKEDWILCIALHPGWVKTELGTAKAELTVEDSVQGILKVLSTLSEKHHGIIVDWTERTVPW